MYEVQCNVEWWALPSMHTSAHTVSHLVHLQARAARHSHHGGSGDFCSNERHSVRVPVRNSRKAFMIWIANIADWAWPHTTPQWPGTSRNLEKPGHYANCQSRAHQNLTYLMPPTHVQINFYSLSLGRLVSRHKTRNPSQSCLSSHYIGGKRVHSLVSKDIDSTVLA